MTEITKFQVPMDNFIESYYSLQSNMKWGNINIRAERVAWTLKINYNS